jgi:hypothetical protein
MTPNSFSRLARLAAPALLLTAAAAPSIAQDLPPSATPAVERTAEPQNSPEALATAARNILELIEVHRFRMARIDSALAYYKTIGDTDRVRQFSLLREREQSAYQQSLETYRRMLGDKDFTRVAGILRNHLTGDGEPAGRGDDAATGERRDATAQTEESAAERAERVRRLTAAQVEEDRVRAAEQTAWERSQAIARARASQRQQLAQRLQQARADQLEARAAAARRYQTPTLSDERTTGFGYPRGGTAPSTPNSPWAGPTSSSAASNPPPPAARAASRPQRP